MVRKTRSAGGMKLLFGRERVRTEIHFGGTVGVVFREAPAADERNAIAAEKIGGDIVHLHQLRGEFGRHGSVDGDRAVGSAAQRDRGGDRCGFDSRKLIDAGKELIVKGATGFQVRVGLIGQRDSRGEDVGWFETHFRMTEVCEAAEQESGAEKQGEGEGDFGGYEEIAEAALAGGGVRDAGGGL